MFATRIAHEGVSCQHEHCRRPTRAHITLQSEDILAQSSLNSLSWLRRSVSHGIRFCPNPSSSDSSTQRAADTGY
jgi:hypothetical protein